MGNCSSVYGLINVCDLINVKCIPVIVEIKTSCCRPSTPCLFFDGIGLTDVYQACPGCAVSSPGLIPCVEREASAAYRTDVTWVM